MIGDVQRGPSSIVAAVGTARRATDAILSRENIRSHQNDKYWNNVNPAEIYQRKGDISVTLVNSDDRDAFVAQEAARCLECNYVCSKCVDVCPNRANVSIAVGLPEPFPDAASRRLLQRMRQLRPILPVER